MEISYMIYGIKLHQIKDQYVALFILTMTEIFTIKEKNTMQKLRFLKNVFKLNFVCYVIK